MTLFTLKQKISTAAEFNIGSNAQRRAFDSIIAEIEHHYDDDFQEFLENLIRDTHGPKIYTLLEKLVEGGLCTKMDFIDIPIDVQEDYDTETEKQLDELMLEVSALGHEEDQ